jgi:hypothetical protein
MSRIGTVWQSIPLIAEAEGIPELEIGASAFRISPHRRSLLSDGGSDAKKAGD